MLLIDFWLPTWRTICGFLFQGRAVSDLLDGCARSRARGGRAFLRVAGLALGRKLVQILHRDLVQGTLIGRMQKHLGNRSLPDLAILEAIERLLPSRRAQAPFAAIGQAYCAQIVALGGGIFQEFLGHHSGHRVIAVILWAYTAVPISVEARDWLFGEEGERLFENCSRGGERSASFPYFRRVGRELRIQA